MPAGTAGDPVPLCKGRLTNSPPIPLPSDAFLPGWLRASLRAVDESNSRHRHYLPHRNYSSRDVDFLEPDKVYNLLVELWPTAVVISPGGSLVLEVGTSFISPPILLMPIALTVQVATADTQGGGIFRHDDPIDR